MLLSIKALKTNRPPVGTQIEILYMYMYILFILYHLHKFGRKVKINKQL